TTFLGQRLEKIQPPGDEWNPVREQRGRTILQARTPTHAKIVPPGIPLWLPADQKLLGWIVVRAEPKLALAVRGHPKLISAGHWRHEPSGQPHPVRVFGVVRPFESGDVTCLIGRLGEFRGLPKLEQVRAGNLEIQFLQSEPPRDYRDLDDGR